MRPYTLSYRIVTASVPITVLLYDGPLLCGYNLAIKGLTSLRTWFGVQNVTRLRYTSYVIA